MITQKWIYQFNLPTLSEVNLSISNNDDLIGNTYLYNVGGSGIGGDYSQGFAFDGILEKGEYVLRTFRHIMIPRDNSSWPNNKLPLI